MIIYLKMSKPWEQLLDQEKQDYYQWVLTLIDYKCLNISTDKEIEEKARRMYECDSYKNPPDPFKELDIEFTNY